MSFDLREQDPDAARFNAIAQSVLFTMIGFVVGFVAAALLVGADHPVGWVIIAIGTAAGAIPIVRWVGDRHTDQLDLFGIDRSLRPLLLRAAAAADRIERAATTTPEGAVCELLNENHRSALAHVKLLERDARTGGHARKAEMLRACHQLDELADTSERLLQTALGSQPTVLNALTERTALVNEALARDAELDRAIERGTLSSEGPQNEAPAPEGDPASDGATSAVSDEDDPADRGATNDR